MFDVSARLIDVLPTDDVLAQLGLDEGGRVQRVVNDAVIRECRPYVPASPNRALEGSVISDVDHGQVIWNTPYAHYQYMGIVYGPNIPVIQDGILMGWFSPPGRPKQPTDRELTYDTSQNKLAGSYWFERMKADRLNDILDEARKAINGR